MPSEIYRVEIDSDLKYLFPQKCYCCMKDTVLDDEIIEAGPTHAVEGGWKAYWTLKFPLCKECYRHRKLSSMWTWMLWSLLLIAGIWVIVMWMDRKVFGSAISGIFFLGLAYTVWRVGRVKRRLKKSGHASIEPKIKWKEIGSKVRFDFENKAFAEEFDRLNSRGS